MTNQYQQFQLQPPPIADQNLSAEIDAKAGKRLADFYSWALDWMISHSITLKPDSLPAQERYGFFMERGAEIFFPWVQKADLPTPQEPDFKVTDELGRVVSPMSGQPIFVGSQLTQQQVADPLTGLPSLVPMWQPSWWETYYTLSQRRFWKLANDFWHLRNQYG